MAPEPFRGFTVRLAALVLLCLTVVTPAHALRYLNWNILNYPGTTGPARDPFYRTVIAPLSPDVIMTQEMTSQAGVTEFLNSMNVMEPGQWAAAAFMDGGDTDAGLFYKPAKLQLLGQWAFYPNPANLLRYVHVWRLKPVGYASDAAEFRVYGVHLKASSGSANQAQRLAEAIGLRDSLNAVPPGTHVLVTGDYNFYSGSEPGYLKLLESQADNDGQLYDPLGLQNLSWQDNVAIQYAWTQSPCKTGDAGCAPGAATGGMDDRFDLILPSTPWQDGSGLELIPGTYVAVGNDGQHHNNSIQDLPVIPEGAAYATALHTVSDHLPVRVDLRLPALVSASQAPLAFGTVIQGAAGVTQTLDVTNVAPAPAEVLSYVYNQPSGFTAPAGTQNAAAGATNHDVIALNTGAPGAFSGIWWSAATPWTTRASACRCRAPCSHTPPPRSTRSSRSVRPSPTSARTTWASSRRSGYGCTTSTGTRCRRASRSRAAPSPAAPAASRSPAASRPRCSRAPAARTN